MTPCPHHDRPVRGRLVRSTLQGRYVRLVIQQVDGSGTCAVLIPLDQARAVSVGQIVEVATGRVPVGRHVYEDRTLVVAA